MSLFFRNLVRAVWLCVGNDCFLSTQPLDANCQVRRLARRKNTDWFVRRRVLPAAHDLLRLSYRTAEHFDASADTKCIRRLAMQANCNARSTGVIAVNAGGIVEVVHDYVEITIVIEIGEGDAM